jgi:hypothetical protein
MKRGTLSVPPEIEQRLSQWSESVQNSLGDDLASVLARAGDVYGVDVAPLLSIEETTVQAHDTVVRLLGEAIEQVSAIPDAPAAASAAGAR